MAFGEDGAATQTGVLAQNTKNDFSEPKQTDAEQQQQRAFSSPQQGLKRKLKSRHLQMIAIGSLLSLRRMASYDTDL